MPSKSKGFLYYTLRVCVYTSSWTQVIVNDIILWIKIIIKQGPGVSLVW